MVVVCSCAIVSFQNRLYLVGQEVSQSLSALVKVTKEDSNYTVNIFFYSN